MDSEVQICPSILAADFLELGAAVRAVDEAGVKRLQIDVMDGRFVPNISVGVPVVQAVRSATNMLLETHLMIVEPEKYIPVFADAGADLIIVHAEVCPNLYRTLEQIRDHGKRAGVAINPGTPAVAVHEVLHIVDLVLIMTVNPGFGGQKFISSALSKVRQVRDELEARELRAEIEVDGGIDVRTAPEAVEAGARVLVAGTSVYGVPQGVQEAIRRLKEAVRAGSSG